MIPHAGHTDHRDRVVPVIDAARRLGLAYPIGAPPWLCLFVRGRAGEMGVPVDAVLGFERPRGPFAADACRGSRGGARPCRASC